MMNNKGKIILGALILVIILFAVVTHETISHNSKADSVKRSDSYIQEEEEKPEVAGARRLARDSFDGSLTFDGIKYEFVVFVDYFCCYSNDCIFNFQRITWSLCYKFE